MDRVKLAICMKDLEYQARFVNCLMNHYKHLYEVHVFTNLEDLKMSKPLEYSAIITGEYTTEEMTDFVEGGEKLLCLTEEVFGDENHTSKDVIFTSKYQEVYKITEILQRLTAEAASSQRRCEKETDSKWIGIYSLSNEKYQIPLGVLLAEICGEEERVLLLDLQAHSGLMEENMDVPYMGLEDLLSVATTGNYRKSRILECIGHGSNWDYVYPVKNTECLVEGSWELYKDLLKMLEKELDYHRFIINFGTVFSGQLEMMEHCDSIYLLYEKETGDNWREEAFFHEIQRREHTQLLQKIKRLHVPSVSSIGGSWKTVLEKWRWSFLGESLRQMISEERKHGAAL